MKSVLTVGRRIAQVLKGETARVPQGMKAFICVTGALPEDSV